MSLETLISSMTPEAWIAAVAALIAFIALFFTGVAAKAAWDQTKTQQRLRIDAAQPYVWADLREDDAAPSLLNFVVGNSGPTLATNVRVTMDPPLPVVPRLGGKVEKLQEQLARGIQSLAPGRVIRWYIGLATELSEQDGARSYRLRVTADGPFGPLEPLEYVIDMDDWRTMRDQPPGSLHQVRSSVDRLTKQMEKMTKALPEEVLVPGEERSDNA